LYESTSGINEYSSRKLLVSGSPTSNTESRQAVLIIMVMVTLSPMAYLAVNLHDWQYVIVEIPKITKNSFETRI